MLRTERDWVDDKLWTCLMPGGWYFCQRIGFCNWGWVALSGMMRLADGHAFTRRGADRAARAAVEKYGRGAPRLGE